MRWLRFIPLFLLAGCVSSTGGVYVTPPESELRLPVREQLVGFVGKSLDRDGWTGQVVSSETTGILSAGADEGWLEDRIVIDATARSKANDEPQFIPLSDFSPVLTAVRKKLVTFVEGQGGVAVDWWTVEAHAERTLVFLYRHGETNGTVRVRMRHRAEDRPEELVTRFEVTMRER
jgi:hypothetical protein